MLYAELSRYPIQITIDSRMIKFWNRIVIGKQFRPTWTILDQLASYTDEGQLAIWRCR